MNYHNIVKDDMRNGDGLRVVLFVAGCDHHCKGCQNPITWDKDGGIPFDKNAKMEIKEQLEEDYISGITLSGGDPFAPYNRTEISKLMEWVKSNYPQKTIWAYTGYKVEELQKEDPIFMQKVKQYVDIIVDGKFVEEKADVNYHWAGSTNQMVIKVNELEDDFER